AHCGGAISPLLGRILGYQDKEFFGLIDDPVHGKTSKRPFNEYLPRMYFDTGGHFGDLNAVRSALLNIPAERIMFGTDYPQEIHSAEEVSRFLTDLRDLGLTDS